MTMAAVWMADYLLFQKAQRKSFSMNSAKRRRMTRQGLLALLCQNRRFEFQKRSQLFIRTHNVTVAAIAAIMVSIVRSIGGYKRPFPIPQMQPAFDLPNNETFSVGTMCVSNPGRSPREKIPCMTRKPACSEKR
jgi:hypothetical protein